MAGSQFFVRSTDDVERLIERDGQFVGISSFGDRKFVLRPATQEDELVALVSALDASGLLKWNELVHHNGPTKDPRYEATLPTKDEWKITLGQRHDEQSYCYLLLANNEGPGASIHQPQVVITNLYYRLYESHGHSLIRYDSSQMIPGLKEIYEREQALIKASLTALSEGI
jgi:hypothetical protein